MFKLVGRGANASISFIEVTNNPRNSTDALGRSFATSNRKSTN
jgi:hypothetical protein